jgi:hypothetical protein
VQGTEERYLLELTSNNFEENIKGAVCCLIEGGIRYGRQEAFVLHGRVFCMEAKRIRIRVP